MNLKNRKKEKINWDIHKQRDKDKKIVDSFNFAIDGILEAIKQEKHMRVHILISIIVLTVSMFLDLTRIEFMILCLTISSVLICELINTGVEALTDLISPNDKPHPLAKLAKDVAAGAVLIASINAVIIGYLILYDKFFMTQNKTVFNKVISRNENLYVSIVALIMIIIITLKAYFKKGTALEGGMPSGHSAIAFTMFSIVLFSTNDVKILVLSFLMAALVAQSRVKSKIHSIGEVVAGGLIGFFVTSIILLIVNNI